MGTALRVVTEPASKDRSRPAGASGTSIHFGYLEHNDINEETRGPLWFGDNTNRGIASEMMVDAHVKRSVEAVVDPLLAAQWDFDAGGKRPIDVEAARYAGYDFFECNAWERTVRVGTTGVVRDGVTAFEWTDSSDRRIDQERFPLHPGNGIGVGYTKAHHRRMSTIDRWVQSDRDSECADGFYQWVDGSDQEEAGARLLSLSKGHLITRLAWDQEDANFEGTAPLRASWGPVKCKRLLLTLYLIRHEREGIGTPTIEEPEGYEATDEEADVAKEILRKLRAHEESYIYLPSGWKFKWTTTSGQSTGLAEAIEQCNRDIAYNLGVAWMLLGIAGKTGSWALATEQRGHYVLSLEKYARFWESAINLGMDGWSPVERLIRRNYGQDVAIPRLVARNMPTRDWTKLLPLLPSLVKAGLLKNDAVLRAFIRTVGYLPVEDTETAEDLSEDQLMGIAGDAAEQDVKEDEAAAERAENARKIEALERMVQQAIAQAERATKFANDLFSDEALKRRAEALA